MTSTFRTLAVDLDQLAATGRQLGQAQTEAQTLLANTLQAATAASTSIRGTASSAWAALLQDWHAQASTHKTQGEQLADGTTNAAKAYTATDGAATFDSVGDASAKAGATAAATAVKTYTNADLYGSGGPSPRDTYLFQENTSPVTSASWLTAAMASISEREPQVIKNAISYDPATQTFGVTLYDVPQNYRTERDTTAPYIRQRKVNLTQADIQTVLDSSHVTAGTPGSTPIWSAVMEAAYAKQQYGSVSAGLPSEDVSTSKLGGIAQGWTNAGYAAITGHSGNEVPATSITYQQLDNAISAGKPISMVVTPNLSTSNEGSPYAGSLLHGGTYSVENVSQAANGDTLVTVRSPWGSVPTPWGSIVGPLVTVNLNAEDYQSNSVDYFDIGLSAQDLGLNSVNTTASGS